MAFIQKEVPQEAEISKITFDSNLGEVIIAAKKPGLVIGKAGSRSRPSGRRPSGAPTSCARPHRVEDRGLRPRADQEEKSCRRILARHRPQDTPPHAVQEHRVRLTSSRFQEVGARACSCRPRNRTS